VVYQSPEQILTLLRAFLYPGIKAKQLIEITLFLIFA